MMHNGWDGWMGWMDVVWLEPGLRELYVRHNVEFFLTVLSGVHSLPVSFCTYPRRLTTSRARG